MRIKKYYSPDPIDNTAAPAAVPELKVEEPIVIKEEPAAAAESGKTPEEKASAEAIKNIEAVEKARIEADRISDEKNKNAKPISEVDQNELAKALGIDEDEGDLSENKKPAKQAVAAAKAPEKKVDDELTFKLESKEPEALKDIESWKDLAGSLQLELKDDNETEFRTAFEAKINAAKEEGRKEGEQTTVEKYLENVNPEAKLLYEFVKHGGKTEDYLKPLAPFERLEKMDNETLVRENFVLQKMSEEDINKQIVDMIDEDTLDSNAEKIRTFVADKKKEFSQEQVKKQTEFYNKSYEADNERIKKAVNSIDKFMDVDLSPDIRKQVANSVPEFRKEILNNDKLVAELLYYHKLGQQAKDIARKQGYNEARNKFQGKLHNLENLPKTDTGSISRVDTNNGKTLEEIWGEGLGKDSAKED